MIFFSQQKQKKKYLSLPTNQSFDMAAAASSFEQMNLSFGKAMKWWQKGLQPNMRAIQTAQDLVDSLTNAGDGLVVIDFFSPGCAGCHALHPKVILGTRRKLCDSLLYITSLPWEFSRAVVRFIFPCADLSVRGEESGCAVPAGEL